MALTGIANKQILSLTYFILEYPTGCLVVELGRRNPQKPREQSVMHAPCATKPPISFGHLQALHMDYTKI